MSRVVFPDMAAAARCKKEKVKLYIELVRNAISYLQTEKGTNPFQEWNLLNSPEYYDLVRYAPLINKHGHNNGLIYSTRSSAEPVKLFESEPVPDDLASLVLDESEPSGEDSDAKPNQTTHDSKEEGENEATSRFVTITLLHDQPTESDTDDEYIWDWSVIDHE